MSKGLIVFNMKVECGPHRYIGWVQVLEQPSGTHICLQFLFYGHHPGQGPCYPTPRMMEIASHLLFLPLGLPLLQIIGQTNVV